MTGIRTLARQLDLSIGTVSRALNGRPDVNARTRERVLEAAQAAGYRPNQSGRALRKGRTSTVGLVLDTGETGPMGGDTFFLLLLDQMQEVLSQAGLDLVLLPSRSGGDPVSVLERQVARGVVDALVLTATRREDPRIAMLLERGVPFLTLGRSETPGLYPWLDLDFERMAQESVARLAAEEHRRIAAAVPQRDLNLVEVYLRGYRKGLAAHGLPHDPALELRACASENGGSKLGKTLLTMPQAPTGVVLAYEQMAVGLYSRMAQEGRVIGRDLSVVGLRDNAQLGFLSPSLACFSLDVGALGRALGQGVLDLLAGRRDTAQVWPMPFHPGGSIGPPEGAGPDAPPPGGAV